MSAGPHWLNDVRSVDCADPDRCGRYGWRVCDRCGELQAPATTKVAIWMERLAVLLARGRGERGVADPTRTSLRGDGRAGGGRPAPRRGGRVAMTVIPSNATDEQLREMYGSDADEIIAFKQFLQLPKDDHGRTLCPSGFMRYARGEITGKQLLEEQARASARAEDVSPTERAEASDIG